MKHNRDRFPLLAEHLLHYFLNHKYPETIIGDFKERFNEISVQRSFAAAAIWLFVQILLTIPSFLNNIVYWNITMLSNYLKIAWRNLTRQKVYSFINVSGLSIGLCCFIFLYIYVNNEISFDRFHANYDRIQRVVLSIKPEETPLLAYSPIPLSPALMREFPEIEITTRLRKASDILVRNDEDNHYETIYYADASVFDVFTLPFQSGDPGSALSEPGTLVISERTAKKYFGNTDPLNQMLTLAAGDLAVSDYRITGVIENMPENSSIEIDFLASFQSLNDTESNWLWVFNTYTFALMREGSEISGLQGKLHDFVEENAGERAWYSIHFQPFSEVHLYSGLNGDQKSGNITHVYLFSGVAILILLIACINFMNLSTARATKRSKEVGLRKVVGAKKGQLVRQFLGESLVLSFMSAVLAIFLVKIFYPFFGNLTGISLQFGLTQSLLLVAGTVCVTVFVGVIAGLYPAFFLSAFSPFSSIHHAQGAGSVTSLTRKGLVVFQFMVTMSLFICTGIMYNQMKFVKGKDLGFDKEQILVVALPQQSSGHFPTFKDELSKNPDILNVSASQLTPASGELWVRFKTEEESEFTASIEFGVDDAFINTYGLQIIAGQDFSENLLKNPANVFIVNEATILERGFKTPDEALGKQLYRTDGQPGTIIGVVKDFHTMSLKNPISGIILSPVKKDNLRYASLKINAVNTDKSLEHLNRVWGNIFHGFPLEYSFLDERFENLYESDMRLGTIIGFFSLLAVFVACLGLVGLVSFTAETKAKEIGIRKILGSTVNDILINLSKEYVLLITTALFISVPASYYTMDKWLRNFVFKVSISWEVFAVTGLFTLGLALLTVSFQILRAATANPIDSLRHE